jgi:hypothetical protein
VVKRINTLFFIAMLMLLVISSSTVQGAERFKPQPMVSLSQSTTWQRQQVILSVEIPTPDEFARIEFETLDLQDFEVIELPFKRSEVADSKNQFTVKIGWILFPLVAGQYEIELPQVVYRPNGGRKIKLKILPQHLSVKSLPSYIPATMPVGKIEIKNTVQTGSLAKIHNTQTLIDWNIKLLTTNVLPQTIPPILRQIKTSKALDVFPETLTKKLDKSYGGLKSNLNYKVPIKALQSGALELPVLSIQYFDPKDGKLKRANSKALNHWAINRYLQWFLLGLLIVGALIALFKLFKIIQTYRVKRRMIHQAINAIEQAKNTEEIRTALHNLSQAKGWQANTTLQQLLTNWQTQKGQDLVLDNVFDELQAVQFSKNAKVSFDNVKNGLINSLKQA